jgi:hypothetical protein
LLFAVNCYVNFVVGSFISFLGWFPSTACLLPCFAWMLAFLTCESGLMAERRVL